MAKEQPRSRLEFGDQETGDVIKLGVDTSLAVDEDYPDPDGDSETFEVDDELLEVTR